MDGVSDSRMGNGLGSDKVQYRLDVTGDFVEEAD